MAAGEPGGEREKAAALGAAWVMEKFLWGPRRKISGYTPAAHTASPREPPAAARRGAAGPGWRGVGAGLPGAPLPLRPNSSALACAPRPLHPRSSALAGALEPVHLGPRVFILRAPSSALWGLALPSQLPSLPQKAGEGTPLSQILVSGTPR